MKRNLLFAFVLSVMMTSCDWLGGGGSEIVPLPELTVTVSDDTVPSGGHYVTITVDTKFAVSTDNNKNMPHSTSWRDSIYVTETTMLIVSAYNIDGIFVKRERTITVLPPVVIIVPNRTDTLCSHAWNYEAFDVLDKDNNLLWFVDLTTDQKSNKYYFYKDGIAKVFHQNGVQFGDCSWKWIDTKTIMIGDQVYQYVLTDKYFFRYQKNNAGTEIYRDTYWRE